MRRKLALSGLFVFVSSFAWSQVPVAELAKPPADARHYVIQSTAGKHGESWIWVTSDGTRMGRESLNLRGQVFEQDSSGKAGKDGMVERLEIRGVTPQGDAGETFSISGGKASWKSPVDAGSAEYSAPAFYSSFGGPIETSAWLLERLLASPDKTLPLLPGGKARAEKLTTLTVGEGANKKEVTAWAITGINNAPIPVWADANNKFFGLYFFLSWLPDAYAGEHQRLAEAQTKALAERAPALVKSLVKTPKGPVAFSGVRLFDAEGVRFLANQTVVVDKGSITASGAAGSVTVPAGAQVIDGRGMTLVPGLWDCHMHVGDDYTGLQELSMGVTSIRDPGTTTMTIDRRTRAANSQLLMPNVYPSSLIDGRDRTLRRWRTSPPAKSVDRLDRQGQGERFTGKVLRHARQGMGAGRHGPARKLGLRARTPHGMRPHRGH